MRKLFYAGVLLWILFEVANVYFIMPLPFSQRVRSIDLAYFLLTKRWVFRGLFTAIILAGAIPAFRVAGWRRAVAPLSLLLLAFISYATNVKMSADHMFLAPSSLDMQPAARNKVEMARLVVGIDVNGDARAYPVQFIGYHHQVRDTVAGTPVMVSFCTVCRTGRVFSPVVDGKTENFRLVGMDHFNAMFEDNSTGTWWRQANGEAIAGPLKGKTLPELESQQVTLAQWLALHPKSLIMQADSNLKSRYRKDFDYETGQSKGALTRTDRTSWAEKAWVVGIAVDGASRAYDWNRLRRERVVNDVIGATPVVLVLAADTTSFFAFIRPDSMTKFTLRKDSLVSGGRTYALTGQGKAGSLERVNASQEFWHSWRTFHPQTSKY